KCHGKKLMIQGKLDDEQKEKHKSYKVCLYCKTHLPDEEKNRVIDHNHITEKFRGPAHSESKVTDEKIVLIANNSEQYIIFSVGQLQFIDSLKFSLPGLAKIAENLRDEKKGQTKTPEQLAKYFPIMSKFISPHLLSLLTRKGIFLYQWLTSKNKFKETQLPPRKDFNSNLDGVNYCEQGCESKEYEYEKIYTITQKDYDFAHTVWKETACKTFGDYNDIYLKMDIFILADAFETFRKASYSAFNLDLANYLTAPGLA
ncbi:34665_t:CDS:2, partial [Racocetra persica]